MNADISMSVEEDYLQYFDLSPAHFPWRARRPQEIEERRGRMSDLLIFDILLSSGGIRQPHTLFPPSDPEMLQALLDAITNSTYDRLKRDCLIYFLLKWHQDGREEDFMFKRCILPQFALLADAYWHLDSGINIARAVSILSDARINKDYPSKVLQALSQSADSHNLIRTFIRTAKPLLTEPNDIDAYAIALAESSLMEAWSYQRSFSEACDTRKRLIYKILNWCLTPQPRLVALTNLIAFPLSPYEQSLIHDYALDPPSTLPATSVPVIQDLVCVRLVQSGQHAAAIKLDRQFASISRGGDKAQKVAHDRRQMMDELMFAMPTAERQLLELELEQFAQGRGMNLSGSLSGSIGPGGKGKGKAVDTSMSMSWEHISPPRANGTIKVSVQQPTPPIPQLAGAPRFGGPSPAPQSADAVFSSISRGTPSTAPQMPKLPSQGPLPFGDISAQPAASTSTPAASGWKPKSTANGASTSLFAGMSNGKPSLFDTAGSANAAPNAFYQPAASAGAKRPLLFSSMARPTPTPPPVSAFASLSAQPVPTASARSARSGRKSGGGDTSFKGPHEADISMLSDLSESDSARADESASVARALDNSADMDVSAEFSVSVFGPSGSARKIATNNGARIARTETEAMLPPGAFLPEDDTEKQDESQSISATKSASTKGKTKRARASASGRTAPRAPSPLPESELEPEPEPEPEPVRTRTSTRRKVVKDKDLGRSIPGSLMDDDDDSEDAQPHQTEEEEDDVPPLPIATPARRARKSRVSNVVNQAEVPRTTRRSSRLSAVSSVGSSSPEPLSPQKTSTRARVSARVSTAGTSASVGAGTKGATIATKTRKKRS